MSFIGAQETNVLRIVASVRALWQGRSNAVGEFTLTPSTTSTVVRAENCGPGSRIALTPRTASAATALASVYIPEATVTNGEFTVVHNSNAATDRKFGYAIQG